MIDAHLSVVQKQSEQKQTDNGAQPEQQVQHKGQP